MRLVRLLSVIIVLVIIGIWVALRQPSSPALTIDGAWVRPALQSGSTAAYLDITNHSNNFITLTGISTDSASTVQIHQTAVENDTTHMQHLGNGLRIVAGETLRLQPGGYHIMLMNVKQSLEEGSTVTLGLTFDNGEMHTIEAQVRLTGTEDLE